MPVKQIILEKTKPQKSGNFVAAMQMSAKLRLHCGRNKKEILEGKVGQGKVKTRSYLRWWVYCPVMWPEPSQPGNGHSLRAETASETHATS